MYPLSFRDIPDLLFQLPAVFVQMDKFSVNYNKAMYQDSFANSHPVHVRVTDPAEIDSIFDTISYNKVN